MTNIISKQIKQGTILISDPFDYERGKNSVKKPIDSKKLRQTLQKFGFTISKNTKNPSFIPWNLKLNQRATLNYKVDVVLAKK